MIKLIFPNISKIKKFILEIESPISQLSIHLNDKQQITVTIEKKDFQLTDSMQEILKLLGFQKTENTNVEEWYSEIIHTEVTFAKACILYVGKLLGKLFLSPLVSKEPQCSSI